MYSGDFPAPLHTNWGKQNKAVWSGLCFSGCKALITLMYLSSLGSGELKIGRLHGGLATRNHYARGIQHKLVRTKTQIHNTDF